MLFATVVVTLIFHLGIKKSGKSSTDGGYHDILEFGWDGMNPAVENKSHFSIQMGSGSMWPLSSPALLYHTSNTVELKHNVKTDSH